MLIIYCVQKLQEYCLDLFEPSGQGRRRRALEANMPSGVLSSDFRNHTQYTKFRENIEYTVLMPGGESHLIMYRFDVILFTNTAFR